MPLSLAHPFDSSTFISVLWTRKERDSVVLAGVAAVGIACSSAHVLDHPPSYWLGNIGFVGVAERYSVAVAVDGVGGDIDSVVVVVVVVAAHSRNRPDCCSRSRPPCCWDNRHCWHRGHHRCFRIPPRCAHERTDWSAAGFRLRAENRDQSLPAADSGRWPCSWW